MKTFKLISLQVVEEYGLIDVKLEDGLVINKEDEKRTWLLEAYVSASYRSYFQNILEKDGAISLQIVISRVENDPAYFQAYSFSIHPISEEFISLLFRGTVVRSNNYAEQLLSHLLHQGLSGDALLKEFKEKMITRPALSSLKKQV